MSTVSRYGRQELEHRLAIALIVTLVLTLITWTLRLWTTLLWVEGAVLVVLAVVFVKVIEK